jgi:hypothetical protein
LSVVTRFSIYNIPAFSELRITMIEFSVLVYEKYILKTFSCRSNVPDSTNYGVRFSGVPRERQIEKEFMFIVNTIFLENFQLLTFRKSLKINLISQ